MKIACNGCEPNHLGNPIKDEALVLSGNAKNFAKKTLQKCLTSLLSNVILSLQTKLGKGDPIMNKDEILKRAREENKGVDEVKRAAETEAAKISMAIGGVACMFLNFLDRIFLQTDVIGDTCWIIYGTMISSRLWIEGIYLKKKSYLFGGALTTAFIILLSVFLFLGV